LTHEVKHDLATFTATTVILINKNKILKRAPTLIKPAPYVLIIIRMKEKLQSLQMRRV